MRLRPVRTQEARTLVAWLVFGAAVVFATGPVWGLFLFGDHPTLDDLLQLRCLSWR